LAGYVVRRHISTAARVSMGVAKMMSASVPWWNLNEWRELEPAWKWSGCRATAMATATRFSHVRGCQETVRDTVPLG
jgi:hypothetical protein